MKTVYAEAIKTTFLIMYCPDKLNASVDFHVSLGMSISGKNVVNICRQNRKKAGLVALGKSHKMPMVHSVIPNSGKKFSIEIKNSMVLWCNCVTMASAGDMPMTFKKPNQNKTTNKAIQFPQTMLGERVTTSVFIILHSVNKGGK